VDNVGYYRLHPDDPRRYVDTTGCGNSIDAGDPLALQMIMDSLRYWLTEMRVDGFRFDLAPTLARQYGSFDKVSAFLDLVSQDPVVARAKLIAEPWDVGQVDSYKVGGFPPLWREWNGRYRDTMRDFWRSHGGLLGDFATRLTGSSDLYGRAGQRPTSSVNMITAHDGFTLADLVSYDTKHNEDNGEANRDGTDDNRSWNCGVEGATTDSEVLALRGRQSRALLATLLLSFGIPMVLGGDELGRTQLGNNNAYCQDNPITWFDWSAVDKELLEFTRRLVTLRQSHPVFRRRRFLVGAEAGELLWFTPAGTPMTADAWQDPDSRSVAFYLDGADAPDLAADGSLMVDDDFLVLVNAWWEPLDFTVPHTRPGQTWHQEIDTFDPTVTASALVWTAADRVSVGPRSLVVLRGSSRP
jgi:glycogen operon protein